MRFRTSALLGLALCLAGLAAGCGKSPPPKSSQKGTTDPGAPGAPTEVGAPLFAPAPAPNYPTVFVRREPIVIPNALVQFEERQIVTAETDGQIELIATYIKPGEKPDPDRVVYHPRDPQRKVPLRRLSEGDDVTAGDVLVFFDDQLVEARIKGANEIKLSAEEALKQAQESVAGAAERVDLIQMGIKAGTESKTTLLDAQLTLARFRENLANARQTIAKSTAELAEATVYLARHRIKSRVNGVIRSIDKRAGHVLKAGDKIMEIEATDRVRIEGHLDVQYGGAVFRGMTVTVEPAVPSAPVAEHKNHRQAVTGIAVTAHPGGPLVVSTGADGAALVWDPNLGKKPNRPTVPHNLPHPVAVRCVAATPPTAKALLVVTGADDGKVRVWDVAARDKLPTAPKGEAEEAHTAAVQAVAISPDGRFCVTAAGREVFVWDLGSAKKLYALPAEHRDGVTAVSFTPQSTLVTASKDGTAKVWKLGTEGAAAQRTLDHRAGAVDVLDASRDGARVLFDQDKGRIDLVDPATGQTVGQLENGTATGAFGALAVFAPDEVPANVPADQLPPYRIATAGGDGELKGALQFWHAPRTGGRGAEVARLIAPNRAPVTTAAFSPVRGEPFLVAGTAAGGVHLWKPPAEARKAHTGRVVNIDPTDTRYLTVRVEMSNAELKLLDRSAATVIITPNP